MFHETDNTMSRTSVAPVTQLALTLFDEIECGLIVGDQRGDIRFANHAAQQELASRRLLLGNGNVLRSATGCSGNLEGALRSAVQRGQRSLVHLTRAGDELLVSVQPLRVDGVDAPLVLVILGRRQACSDVGLEMLAGSVGLTLTERRVLAALVRRLTPREIASAHAVKLSTVRTQISSLRTKFGARSIEGLLQRVAQMPPVASALRLAGSSASVCAPTALRAA
jgi:DNA-binding CsgD family transcriptional regulator